MLVSNSSTMGFSEGRSAHIGVILRIKMNMELNIIYVRLRVFIDANFVYVNFLIPIIIHILLFSYKKIV